MERAIILTRVSFIALLINRFKWRKKPSIYFLIYMENRMGSLYAY